MLKRVIAVAAILVAVTGCSRVEAVARGHRVFKVPTVSMEPTIHVGADVETRPVADGGYQPKRGDIVVFDAYQSWEPMRKVLHIARVIGIGGDRVEAKSGGGPILLNGRALDEKAYIYPGDSPAREAFDVTVPVGRLWLMGDHRSVAADSRFHMADPGGGTVAADRVVAVVIAR